ncbi:MAG: fatty acyl-AMP ligase, partial [Synechococcaceae cyanobacterium RL_1_2]|nr:fatty acyl-AMP ligase [Synechococcaceae cyanobacterium RL_1_2]
MQYTSGSTGDPKGVMISHGNLVHNSYLIREYFETETGSSVVSWLPPYHDMGLIGGILGAIYGGMHQVLMPPATFLQKPLRWLKAISDYRAAISGGPNFAYDLCVDTISDDDLATLDLSCWELAFSGAEPVRAPTIDKFIHRFGGCGFRAKAFYPCYGMAETTLIVTGHKRGELLHRLPFNQEKIHDNRAIAVEEQDPDATFLVSSGRVKPPQKLFIVHPET